MWVVDSVVVHNIVMMLIICCIDAVLSSIISAIVTNKESSLRANFINIQRAYSDLLGWSHDHISWYA